MKTPIFLFCTFFMISFIACSKNYKMFDKPISSRVANYSIECNFDPVNKLIIGTEFITWTNKTNLPVKEMQFHLYMNAFSNENSTFLKELGESPKELRGSWGYCKINKLYLGENVDLTQNISFIQPDDDNKFDSTVVSLKLPDEIQPNESIELTIEFTTKLPPLIERSGYIGSFHMASQWFPKVGVYSDLGWNCHQYHSNSEFFADFGIYDVTIIIPDEFMVGATGILIDEVQMAGNRKRLHYYAEDVHDFAWGADSNFVEINDHSGKTEIRLLAQKEHTGEVVNRILHATKSSHQYFTKRYGQYPYPQITILDSPVFNAVMEYPTLFLTGNFDGYDNPPAPVEPQLVENLFMERLTMHEFGHQWFYGMCANNEFEEAWLDEGLTEYITAKAFEAEYGKIMQNDEFGKPLPVRDYRKQMYIENYTNLPILNYSWHYPTFSEYYVGSYVKPKLLFYTLDNYFGEAVMEEIIYLFFQRWQFNHPKTQDFVDIITEIAGEEIHTIIQQYLETSDFLDYKIESVYQNRVKVSRIGQQIFPVNIEFTFKGNKKISKQWKAEESEITYEFDKEPHLTRVCIDPEQMIEFELNTQNNCWNFDN